MYYAQKRSTSKLPQIREEIKDEKITALHWFFAGLLVFIIFSFGYNLGRFFSNHKPGAQPIKGRIFKNGNLFNNFHRPACYLHSSFDILPPVVYPGSGPKKTTVAVERP